MVRTSLNVVHVWKGTQKPSPTESNYKKTNDTSGALVQEALKFQKMFFKAADKNSSGDSVGKAASSQAVEGCFRGSAVHLALVARLSRGLLASLAVLL